MAGLRTFWVRAAFVLALLLPVYFLVAAFGTKFGLLDWRVGFGLMTFRLGGPIVLGVLVLGVIGLLLAFLVKPQQGWRQALVAVLIPAAMLGYGASVAAGARDVPPIHDISTDLVDPPSFTAETLAARATVAGVNPVDFRMRPLAENPTYAPMAKSPRFKDLAGKTVGDIQAQAYPDLKPIPIAIPADDAIDVAADAAASLGWEVTNVDPDAGIMEAVSRSFWYGFADDIVVRVRMAPDGSNGVMDVRSVSRVGVGDLGANAKRVQDFRAAVSKTLDGAATGG
jgi:uncharacterized protein (DUF1499 family)